MDIVQTVGHHVLLPPHVMDVHAPLAQLPSTAARPPAAAAVRVLGGGEGGKEGGGHYCLQGLAGLDSQCRPVGGEMG
jgi:hypothetical protein